MPAPVLPPPVSEQGVMGWVHANLFSTRFNTALTVISCVLLAVVLWYGLRWLIMDSDWTVIGTLGGLLIMGPYNTEGACPGQNCFWRPQVALMLVTMLLGMGWAIAGGGLMKRYAIGIVAALAVFSLLPYSLEEMGMDVRLLLAGQHTCPGVGLVSWPATHRSGNSPLAGHTGGCYLCYHPDSAEREWRESQECSRCPSTTGAVSC